MDEAALLQRIRQGEVRALQSVIDQYTAYTAAVVSHILCPAMSQEDVEETVSDVFLVIWKRADRIRPGKLKAYLASTARNLALKRLRQAGFDAPLEEDILFVAAEGPDSIAQRRELERSVRRAVEQMPSPDREIFLRHYYHCQSVDVIAREMCLGSSAVKMRLKRGREKLKTILSREE